MASSSLLYEIDTHTCDETTFNLLGVTLGDRGGCTGKCLAVFSTLFLASFFIYQSQGALLGAPI